MENETRRTVILDILKKADLERATQGGTEPTHDEILETIAAKLASSIHGEPANIAFPFILPENVRTFDSWDELKAHAASGSRERETTGPDVTVEQRNEDRGDDPDDTGSRIYGEEIEIQINRPLILVPGIMGSALSLPMATGPHLPIWPPTDFKLSAALQQLGHNSPKVPSGLFPGVYTALLQWLGRMGYEIGQNFWIFDYDWTQHNRSTGDKLAAKIEQILNKHPEWSDVDIIAHSMGGIVTRSAYLNSGSANKIFRVIYLASPHFGSPKAYFVLHPDINKYGGGALGFFKELIAEVVWDRVFSQAGDEGTLQSNLERLAAQMQSVFELIPDGKYLTVDRPMVTVEEMFVIDSGQFGFTNAVGPRFSTRDVVGVDATYKTDNCQLPAALHPHIENAMDFKRSLGGTIPPGGENKTLVIYADRLRTLDIVEKNDHILTSFEEPEESGDGGDQTVPTYSAKAGNVDGITRKIVQEEHTKLPDHAETLRHILEFLDESS